MPSRTDPTPNPLTRRGFLVAGGGFVGAAALGGGAVTAIAGRRPVPLRPRLPARAFERSVHGVSHYRSVGLQPASLEVSARGVTAPGHLFVGPFNTNGAQPGVMIANDSGEPLWFSPVAEKQWVTNFHPTSYLGTPALAWWQGTVIPPGYGYGEAPIVDMNYRPLAHVQAANGRQIDLHELQITPEGTALFTCRPPAVKADLRSAGGPSDGTVLESIFQEVDLRTGKLLLEWRSLEHIPVEDSYHPISEPWDYLHLNSIQVTPDGQLLISGRHTWAMYKLDRKTGAVIWTLGGKRSDFRMGPDAQFAWQHDGRQVTDTTFTVFDDGSDGPTRTHRQSRGLVLNVDQRTRSARLARQYYHPGSPVLAAAMGNVQVLEKGHVAVGWGFAPYLTEFAADGQPVVELSMAKGQFSYRGYRAQWAGEPSEPPAIATESARTGANTVYASWNGSTSTRSWQVLGGAHPSTLRTLGYAPWQGFETAISIPRGGGYVRVIALDGSGRPLGSSAVARI
jgi:hypothetical protein